MKYLVYISKNIRCKWNILLKCSQFCKNDLFILCKLTSVKTSLFHNLICWHYSRVKSFPSTTNCEDILAVSMHDSKWWKSSLHILHEALVDWTVTMAQFSRQKDHQKLSGCARASKWVTQQKTQNHCFNFLDCKTVSFHLRIMKFMYD